MDYEKQSELLKVLGHPVRMRIVEGLQKSDGCNVSKIVRTLKVPQSSISQHLKILKTAGVISSRKEGVKTCYRVVDKRAYEILKILRRKN